MIFQLHVSWAVAKCLKFQIVVGVLWQVVRHSTVAIFISCWQPASVGAVWHFSYCHCCTSVHSLRLLFTGLHINGPFTFWNRNVPNMSQDTWDSVVAHLRCDAILNFVMNFLLTGGTLMVKEFWKKRSPFGTAIASAVAVSRCFVPPWSCFFPAAEAAQS